MLCLQCGTDTNNPKFCSKSCAVTFNNTLYPKRSLLLRFCKHCGVEIFERKTVCDECNPSFVDWSTRTKGELKSIRLYQLHSRIRTLSRKAYIRSGKPLICAVCSYNINVDICHIKSVDSFSDDTPVSVINDLTNLVALCKNHHWEFDNDLLTL